MAILIPYQDCQINITGVQGVQLTRIIGVTRSYPDNHGLSPVGIQAWRRDFHLAVNALSVIQQARKLTLDVPGGPLSEVRDWIFAKKSGPSPE